MAKTAAAIMDEAFEASAWLQPGGQHLLELRSAIGVATFTEGQIAHIEAAIAEFKEITTFEDGRPDTRVRPKRVMLERRG